MRIPAPRKVKAHLQTLILLVGVFLMTLCLCVGFVIFFLHVGSTLVSPLSGKREVSGDEVQRVEALAKQDAISYKSVVMQPDGSVELVLENNAQVFLSSKKDIKNQLASLQQAISQLTIKGKQFRILDFRFATAVVSF